MKNLMLLMLSLFILYSCKQKTAEEYYEIGNAKSTDVDFHEAIKNYSYAIEINPKFAEAYYMRAKAYLDQNDFDIFLANESDKASIKNNGDRDLANKDLNKAIELNPKYIDAYKTRAALKLENGPNIDAFKDYNKLIELCPNNDEYYGLRAKLKYELNDFRSAIEDYKKALKINPKGFLYYFEMGFIYGTIFYNPLFNKKEELANYEKAYGIDTTNAYFLINIANTKTEIKDHKGAIVCYTKYLESKYFNESMFKKSDILIERGKAKILAGMIESGLDDFSLAGELGNQDAYNAIAEYEGQNGLNTKSWRGNIFH